MPCFSPLRGNRSTWLKGPVAELRKSAAGFLLPETAEKVEVLKK